MSQNVAKDYRVMVLPLKQVEPDPDNIRIDYEIESLRQALRAALERGEEFEEPISVYATSRKGTYRI
ncbi:MAG: hypothetical protein KGJ86_08555, partial [Chloroflexota bacterium]|nr:hypothetical protein [Chloroflexota bacterium]